MAITVACPSCEAKLKIGDQHSGRKIKCPKCENLIAVPPANGEEGPPARKSQARSEEKMPLRKKSRVPDDEEDTEEEPKPKVRPKKKKKKAKSGKGLWIGLGAAGGLVLIGGVVLVIVLMNNSGNTKNPPGPVGKGENPPEVVPNGQNPNGVDHRGTITIIILPSHLLQEMPP